MGLMDSIPPVDLKREDLMNGWTNFYRSDDWSSTAYFYLDKPSNDLPALANSKTQDLQIKIKFLKNDYETCTDL
jgi:hypothetical protein